MSSSRTKRKGPVSRRRFDRVVAYWQSAAQAIGDMDAKLRDLASRLHFQEQQTEAVNQAKVAAERARDMLQVRVDDLVSQCGQWQARFTAVSQRNSRLQRHRELLLDVMTSAEGAGTDFSATHGRREV